jgi:lipopolysaccharide/colanic/teichoic acid biosynthesis glycosyltransferase/glycosyltransferase involved in cell wall biosynthesis
VRILMLTQWFDPEPAFKGLELARQLVRRGHQVEVLTGFPNYPEGRLYPGYRLRIWQREAVDGIPVIRVPLYPSHDRSALRRALNYASFAVAAALLGPALARRPDAIYVYHPPGTIGLPALVLGRWFSAPVVYDVQDLWPDTVASTGMLRHGLAMRLLAGFCRVVYRHVERVVVLSPGFRQALVEQGVDGGRIDVIYNWAPQEQTVRISDRSNGGKFTVVYAGTMGLAQGLDAVLEAAAQCLRTVPCAQFLFVGDGVDADRLKQRAEAMRLTNVEFRGRQPLAVAQETLAAAGALLVHLKDDPLFAITIPSKTQAYLAAGRPIVMAVRGDAANLVARAGAGVLAQPGDPESIAEAVRQVAEMPEAGRARMGRAGREFYQTELALGRAVEKFEAVFESTRRTRPVAVRGGLYRRYGKRFLDITASGIALVLLLPLLAVIAATIRIGTGRPVFFRQPRPGRNGRILTLWKFRTMSEERDAGGTLLPEGRRVSRVGRILRAASLDELPELWNVLKGDMSLVGPRPLLVEYLPFYSAEQRRRHEVRPGITGLAQISGRNVTTWDRRLEMDIDYVDHYSLARDCGILLRTILAVWRGDGGIGAMERLGRFRGASPV